MLSSRLKWNVCGLLLMSTQVFAGTGTASFSGVSDGGSNFDEFTVNNGQLDITVSSWSDTVNDPVGAFDDVIERAKDLDKYNGGWAMENMDESGDYCNTYGHSADNFGTCDYVDYDFFMLDFGQAVTLTGATFSWINGSASNNQVSIVALDAGLVAANGGNINGLTWASINSSYALGSGYAQMKSNSGYYIDTMVPDTGESLDQESTIWLVGAFNSVFGGDNNWEGDDGFKLASVAYSIESPRDPKGSSIPEPTSLALIGLALAGLASNRRKKLHK